jgi:hypothetical protein
MGGRVRDEELRTPLMRVREARETAGTDGRVLRGLEERFRVGIVISSRAGATATT